MKETLFVQMKRTVIQGLMCAPFTAAQDSIDTYTYLLKIKVLVSMLPKESACQPCRQEACRCCISLSKITNSSLVFAL